MPNLPMPEGLGPADLECLMVDIAPLPVLPFMHENARFELFYGTIPELKWAQGAVAETRAHTTLMFGIHPSPTYREDVDKALGNWEPKDLWIRDVDVFPIRRDDQEYFVLKGNVNPSGNLKRARKRLETLDHSDPFPGYHPHVTLAYVLRWADIDVWIKSLNAQYADTYHRVVGLNYGD